MKVDLRDDLQYGDEVIVEGRPDYKQPYTFKHYYHFGGMKLSDRFGYPLILDANQTRKVSL